MDVKQFNKQLNINLNNVESMGCKLFQAIKIKEQYI